MPLESDGNLVQALNLQPDPASRCECPAGTLLFRKDKSRRSTTLSLTRGEWRRRPECCCFFRVLSGDSVSGQTPSPRPLKVPTPFFGVYTTRMIVPVNDATSPNKVISRIIFWTPAVAYAGFLLAGSEQGPNKIGMMVTTGFMGALLGFLLGIMFTLRELRRSTR